MYSKAIIDTHCFIPKGDLTRGIDKVKERLTTVSKFEDDDGSRTTVPLWAEKGDMFGIPRYYFKEIPAHEIIYKDCIGKPVNFKFRSSPDHPKYIAQQRMADRFREHVKNRKTGFVLVAKTAFGKTACCLHLLQILGTTALVVVPKDDLLGQWQRRIKKHTDIPCEDVGIVQQDRCEFRDKKIVVAMMHSLTLRKKPYPKELYSHFGAVVVDEAHKLGAEKLGMVSTLFNARYRIGLTATPYRRDGMNDILAYHFGQVWLSSKNDEVAIPKIVIKHLSYTKPISIASGVGKMARRARIISYIARNNDRNNQVAFYISRMFEKGRKMVGFSDRLQQLKTLKAKLVYDYHIHEEQIGLYIGGVPDADRIKMAEKCQILLATYQSMDMGTDIPALDALIFITPRSDIVQPMGRILRFMDGKKQPVVVDLVDTTIKDCIIMGKVRENKYHELGYEVTKI